MIVDDDADENSWWSSPWPPRQVADDSYQNILSQI